MAGAGFTFPLATSPSRKEASAWPAVALEAAGFGPCVKAALKLKTGVLAPVCRLLKWITRYSKPDLMVWRDNDFVRLTCGACVSLPRRMISVAPSEPPVTTLAIEL